MDEVPIAEARRSNYLPMLARNLSEQIEELRLEKDFWLRGIVTGLNKRVFGKNDNRVIYFVEIFSRPYQPFERHWYIFLIYKKEEEKFSQFIDKLRKEGFTKAYPAGKTFLERWHGSFQLGRSHLEISQSSFFKGGEITEIVKDYFEMMDFEVTVNTNEDK